MTNYELILNGLREFYSVNEDLRKDLEEQSMEYTGRSLDTNIKLFAKANANNKYTKQIIKELDDLNSEPHSISEMEVMYEFIDNFSLMEV